MQGDFPKGQMAGVFRYLLSGGADSGCMKRQNVLFFIFLIGWKMRLQ